MTDKKHFDLWDENHIVAIFTLDEAEMVANCLACVPLTQELAAELKAQCEKLKDRQGFKKEASNQMGTVIRNDPKGEIQAAIDELVKQSIAIIAPCLIDGHTPDDSTDITVREHLLSNVYKRRPIASRNDGQGNVEAVYFKLCAICGAIYEEKPK